MNKKILLSLFIIATFAVNAINNNINNNIKLEKTRPKDFVNVKELIPEIQTDIRYCTDHNFVGRRINGYNEPICLLTKSAAMALRIAEKQLLSMGLTFNVYDCYRPQSAVNDFASWATQINNTIMQAEFYPTVNKENLFKDGYIAYRSGHSRGSTIDLTIVELNSTVPTYHHSLKQSSCEAPIKYRYPDNSLDFGTSFDCFSLKSHPNYQKLSSQIKANRLLLQIIMKQAGFEPLNTEWWYFTLANEPYPDVYFDFPVEN